MNQSIIRDFRLSSQCIWGICLSAMFRIVGWLLVMMFRDNLSVLYSGVRQSNDPIFTGQAVIGLHRPWRRD